MFICVAWIQFQANECWPKVNKCWPKISICCKLTKRIYSWLFGNIQMFFKCKTFVNIAELLFTAIFSKENICKNGQKIEKCQNFKKKHFHQFTRYDDMSEFGWKHVPPKCFGHLIILTNLLHVKPPSTFKASWKNDVFWPTFSLQPKFSHVWSTSVDQNFFMTRKPWSSPTQP